MDQVAQTVEQQTGYLEVKRSSPIQARATLTSQVLLRKSFTVSWLNAKEIPFQPNHNHIRLYTVQVQYLKGYSTWHENLINFILCVIKIMSLFQRIQFQVSRFDMLRLNYLYLYLYLSLYNYLYLYLYLFLII